MKRKSIPVAVVSLGLAALLFSAAPKVEGCALCSGRPFERGCFNIENSPVIIEGDANREKKGRYFLKFNPELNRYLQAYDPERIYINLKELLRLTKGDVDEALLWEMLSEYKAEAERLRVSDDMKVLKRLAFLYEEEVGRWPREIGEFKKWYAAENVLFRLQQGELPLRVTDPAPVFRNQWGHDYVYEPEKKDDRGGYAAPRIICLGRDGETGGAGVNKDSTMAVMRYRSCCPPWWPGCYPLPPKLPPVLLPVK